MADFESPWPGIQTSRDPALAFANTLDWRLRKQPTELLLAYTDLIRWGRTLGTLSAAEAVQLKAWSESNPYPASTMLADARELRESMAAAFQAIVREQPIPTAALRRIERQCLDAWSARELAPNDGGVAWRWREGEPSPRRPLWFAALEAARLLTTADRERICQCADAECGWFFLDVSRNRSRRWCSMKGCGNRNKVRRFYQRSASRKTRKTKTRSDANRA